MWGLTLSLKLEFAQSPTLGLNPKPEIWGLTLNPALVFSKVKLFGVLKGKALNHYQKYKP